MATRKTSALTALTAIEVSAPMHEQVYQKIVHALMSGHFEPGQKLTYRKVADQLGISPMPVRTAFQRLQALRALELLPNGSVEVPLLTVEGFSNLTEARIAIESVATVLATPRLTASQLKTIRRHCEERTFAAKAGDIDRYLQANFDFKFAIYRQCGNAHLFFLIETLWLQAGPFLRKFVEGSGFLITEILDVDSHYRVLSALEAREPNEAAAAMTDDIRDAASHLLKHAHFGGIST